MKYNIAIIGSTGLVGRNTLQILVEQGLVEHNYYLFVSARSVGKTQKIGETKHVVQLLNKENLLNRHFDFALFCTRENISKTYVKLLAKRCTKVIDFSSAFRKDYPLIVQEINFYDIGNSDIICNPNCSANRELYAPSWKWKMRAVFYFTRMFWCNYSFWKTKTEKSISLKLGKFTKRWTRKLD